jgi:hypothetical protein
MRSKWRVDLLKYDMLRGWLVEESREYEGANAELLAWKHYRTHEPPPLLIMQIWSYTPPGRTPAYACAYPARWSLMEEKQGAEEFC